MPMYNLLECSDNYFIKQGSLWNYCIDEMTANYRVNNKTTTSKCLEYRTKINQRTPANNNVLNTRALFHQNI